jgi:hypothetical protein
MTWGRSFICSREIEPAFETTVNGLTIGILVLFDVQTFDFRRIHFEATTAVQLLLVDCFLTTMASRDSRHQAEFGDPSLASVSELSECLVQINLDTCIEGSVIFLHSAHQPQYCSFRRNCEPPPPSVHYPVYPSL